jgi:hypothetical protein
MHLQHDVDSPDGLELDGDVDLQTDSDDEA